MGSFFPCTDFCSWALLYYGFLLIFMGFTDFSLLCIMVLRITNFRCNGSWNLPTGIRMLDTLKGTTPFQSIRSYPCSHWYIKQVLLQFCYYAFIVYLLPLMRVGTIFAVWYVGGHWRSFRAILVPGMMHEGYNVTGDRLSSLIHVFNYQVRAQVNGQVALAF